MSNKHLLAIGASEAGFFALTRQDITKVKTFEEAKWVYHRAYDMPAADNFIRLRLEALFMAGKLMKTFEEAWWVYDSACSDDEFGRRKYYKEYQKTFDKFNFGKLRLEALSMAVELIKTFEEAWRVYEERSAGVNFKLKAFAKAGKLMETFKEAELVYREASGKLKNKAFAKAMVYVKAFTLEKAINAYKISTEEIKIAAFNKVEELIKTFNQARNIYDDIDYFRDRHRFSKEFKTMVLTKAGELAMTIGDTLWFYENTTDNLRPVAFAQVVKLMKTFKHAVFVWDKIGNDPMKLMNESVVKARKLAKTPEEISWVYDRVAGDLKVKLLAKFTKTIKTFGEAQLIYNKISCKELQYEILFKAVELAESFKEAEWIYDKAFYNFREYNKLLNTAIDKAKELMKTPEEAKWVYGRICEEYKIELLPLIAQLPD